MEDLILFHGCESGVNEIVNHKTRKSKGQTKGLN